MNSMKQKDEIVYLLLEDIIHEIFIVVIFIIEIIRRGQIKKHKCGVRYSLIERIPNKLIHMGRLLGYHNTNCIDNSRMDRNAFGRLCFLLRNMGGLVDGKHVCVEEQVVMFLGIFAHYKKNRIVKFKFLRSGQTVSHYVHLVLRVVLQLHTILLVRLVPVPDDCTDRC